MADLSRNCKGFRARESVHARVTESRAVTRAGDGRWPRYQAKSLACPICVFINLWSDIISKTLSHFENVCDVTAYVMLGRTETLAPLSVRWRILVRPRTRLKRRREFMTSLRLVRFERLVRF